MHLQLTGERWRLRFLVRIDGDDVALTATVYSLLLELVRAALTTFDGFVHANDLTCAAGDEFFARTLVSRLNRQAGRRLTETSYCQFRLIRPCDIDIDPGTFAAPRDVIDPTILDGLRTVAPLS